MKLRQVRIKFFKAIGILLTSITFLFLYTPIILILTLSINNSERAYSFEGFTLKWYVEVFQNEVIRDPILNTLSVAIIATILSTVLGTIFAIGINALQKNKRIRMMTVNNIPVVNPDIVTGISLMIIFSLLSFTLGFYTVLLAHIFFSIPYVILNVMPKLKKLDSNLYEAALDLGCSKYTALSKVILPNISTGILAGGLMAFTMSIDDFVITYFTSGNEYMNVSTWLYAVLGRGRSFTPAIYSYNALIFIITVIFILVINFKKDRKERAV
ncbi:MAG: ABC transporter permease [Candidatus Izemoplasmatales bacterium]